MQIKISEHAVNRYRERIDPLLPEDVDLARLEIFDRICEAKPKHLRKINKQKATTIVPITRGYLIFSYGTIVTALAELSIRNNGEEA